MTAYGSGDAAARSRRTSATLLPTGSGRQDHHERGVEGEVRGRVLLSEGRHAFRNKYGLRFTLLSDPAHQTMAAYGAWGDRPVKARA